MNNIHDTDEDVPFPEDTEGETSEDTESETYLEVLADVLSYLIEKNTPKEDFMKFINAAWDLLVEDIANEKKE